jgi:hypothetical protein
MRVDWLMELWSFGLRWCFEIWAAVSAHGAGVLFLVKIAGVLRATLEWRVAVLVQRVEQILGGEHLGTIARRCKPSDLVLREQLD